MGRAGGRADGRVPPVRLEVGRTLSGYPLLAHSYPRVALPLVAYPGLGCQTPLGCWHMPGELERSPRADRVGASGRGFTETLRRAYSQYLGRPPLFGCGRWPLLDHSAEVPRRPGPLPRVRRKHCWAGNNVTLLQVLAELREECHSEDLALRWSESMAASPRGVPAFLTPAEVVRNRDYCGLDAQIDSALTDAAQRIAQSEALRRLAWHCKWRLFDCPEADELKGWPTLERSLGDRGGVFYLLVGLAMAPHVQAFHQSLGIPESVTRDTCLQVRGF